MDITLKKCAVKALKNPCSLAKEEYYGNKTYYCDYIIYLRYLKSYRWNLCLKNKNALCSTFKYKCKHCKFIVNYQHLVCLMIFENNDIGFHDIFLNVANEYNKLIKLFKKPSLSHKSVECLHSDIFSTYRPGIVPCMFGFVEMELFDPKLVPETKKELLKLILENENEYSEYNMENLIQAYLYIQKYLKSSEGDLFLTFQALIDVNNLVLNIGNVMLRHVQVKPQGYNYHYMDFRKIAFHLQILIDDWNSRFLTQNRFIEYFLKIHPFLDGNGRTCKVLFV